MVAIVDYGAGNLLSIKNMLSRIGQRDVVISSNPEQLARAEKFILPGVGHFDYGMNQLNSSGVLPILTKKVMEEKVPILGICLGAQLITQSSEEGHEKGLGWIDAKTLKFDKEKLLATQKIPHMGWNDVELVNQSQLFDGMYDEPRFYFVHTYYINCANESDVAVRSNYGHDFVAGFERENVMGVQFHPEKSHKFGKKLLENFLKHY